MEWPERPDPAGPKPPDWPFPDEHWLAYRFICIDGWTWAKVAEQFGMSRATVTHWAVKWRKVYGPDIIDRTRGKLTSTRAAIGSKAGVAARQGVWREQREAAASQFGEAAHLARRVAMAALQLYLDDPAMLYTLTPADLKTLGEVADTFARRADHLEGIPSPEVSFAATQINVGTQGLLDGLETHSLDGDVLDTAEAIVSYFEGGEDADIIELTQRNPSDL